MSGSVPIGPDNTLPGDLVDPEPGSPNQDLPHELKDPEVKTPLDYLKLFFPKYFSPDPVDPDIVDAMLDVARMARPACLSFRLQNIAQAYYAAYLIEEQLRNTSPEDGGTGGAIHSGIIASESEGDISVSYDNSSLNATSSGDASSSAPSSAWDKWKRLSDLCRYGAITTRWGQRY